MKIRWLAILFVAVFVVSCGQSEAPKDTSRNDKSIVVEPAPPAVPVQGTGTIVGEVKFAGVPPAAKRLAVNKDKEVCGEFKDSEELVVGPNKGVKWAAVSLKASPMDMRWEGTTLDQEGCRFSPHVRLIPAGSKLIILNPDGVLHNFHTYSEINPVINKAQPKFKKEMEVTFEKPERFRIGCDAHSWMSGWIVVIDHPFYAVTDENGSFRFEVVPAGKHVLEIWHETLGELVAEVEVKAGETTKVLYEMKK